MGAEYEVQFSADSTTGVLQPYLYSVTSAGVTTQLNGGAPLNFGVSSNGESVEIAIPQALLDADRRRRTHFDQFRRPDQQRRSLLCPAISAALRNTPSPTPRLWSR